MTGYPRLLDGGTMIPLLRALQVCGSLAHSDVQPTHICEGNRTGCGYFHTTYDPRHWGGVKITKTTIAQKRDARLPCPFGDLF